MAPSHGGLGVTSRRTLRRGVVFAAALGLSAALSGCGFELRRAPELRFHAIQLRGFGSHSALAEALTMQIDASQTTRVVESIGQLLAQNGDRSQKEREPKQPAPRVPLRVHEPLRTMTRRRIGKFQINFLATQLLSPWYRHF